MHGMHIYYVFVHTTQLKHAFPRFMVGQMGHRAGLCACTPPTSFAMDISSVAQKRRIHEEEHTV